MCHHYHIFSLPEPQLVPDTNTLVFPKDNKSNFVLSKSTTKLLQGTAIFNWHTAETVYALTSLSQPWAYFRLINQNISRSI